MIGRLNTFLFIVNVISFPPTGKKCGTKDLLLFLWHWFSVGCRITWWSNDWSCSIGSKVFCQRSVLGGMPFSVNKPKTIQPLETTVIPWDIRQLPVKRSVFVCAFCFISYMAVWLKNTFFHQSRHQFDSQIHKHRMVSLRKIDWTGNETTQARCALCSSRG